MTSYAYPLILRNARLTDSDMEWVYASVQYPQNELEWSADEWKAAHVALEAAIAKAENNWGCRWRWCRYRLKNLAWRCLAPVIAKLFFGQYQKPSDGIQFDHFD